MSASPLRALFDREREPPVEEAALLIAQDFAPGLDPAATRAALDALAAPVAPRLARAADDREAAALLGTWLFDEQGFRGNEDDYYDPRNSHLHEVVARRTGIPITLAVVMIAVGRRAGVRVEGIGFPGHFLARVFGPGAGGGALVDPFFRGREVTPAALDALARRALGDPARLRPEHLAPADARAVAVRMLGNLRGVHEARGDHAGALVACDRLVDLTGSPEARRDRARHLLALGAHEAAADDLDAWLRARPDAPDAGEVRRSVARLRSSARRPPQ
ncbi:MAG: transglutaminase-like domain-containing protein [Polyangiales bacterium]